MEFGIFDEFEGLNKSMVIPSSDLDNDGSLGQQETLAGLHKYFAVSSKKALQVDCSVCF